MQGNFPSDDIFVYRDAFGALFAWQIEHDISHHSLDDETKPRAPVFGLWPCRDRVDSVVFENELNTVELEEA